ncbi:MAG: hypothetical protein HKN09_01145, partial [Saprospiraceae bacterium]|nr:hypothetical protein [Saprospiraceae bacterium]
MKNYKIIYHLSFLFCLLMGVQELSATHVAGGSMTYRCLGNSRYEITLEFRRDCFNGATDAQFDDPARLGIFDGINRKLVEILGEGGRINIPLSMEDTLNETIISECNIIGGDVCTQTTTYRDTVVLPYRVGNGGYYIAYQRCCRNVKLNNIEDPLEAGSTYWVRITEEALRTCNSAPVFKSWPVSFLCVNDTLRFDHGAIDADGDSLVYEFCAPSIGATRQFPKPNPPADPPYGIVEYKPGFSANRPFGQNIFIDINSETGEIVGLPTLNGQYLVGVCVREFRNGELLTEVRRDFEYIVRTCGRAPDVMFETDPPGITSKCDGLDIAFSNNTESNFQDPDSLDYIWYFDWPNNTLVSTEMDPAIIYPNPGLYTIALIGDDGTCQDTFFYELGISTPVDPEVGFEIFSSNCEGDVELYLLDTTITDQIVLEREWILVGEGFTDTLYGINPSTFIGFNQEVEVTLNIYTESGCDGVLVDTLLIEPPVFNNEFVDQIICDNAPTLIFTNPNENSVVTIIPDDNIVISGNEYNLVNFSGEQDFIITVSDTFCSTTDTITIQTFPQPDLNLEDIVQCGQDTVAINPNGDPDYYYVWSSTLDSLPFNENESNPIFSIDTTAEFYVQVFTSENSNCFSFDTMEVKVVPYPEFEFFPSANIITCQDSSLTISVNSMDSVVWTNAGGIQIGTGPEITINQVIQNAVLTATVINSDGCATAKEVRVSISSEPDFSFTADTDETVCIGDSATLEIISTDSIVWTSIDGDVLQIGNTITLDSVTEAVTVIVTAYNQFGCPGSDMITVNTYDDPSFEIIDSTELDVCFGESTIVNVSTPDSVVWTDLDGNILNLGNAIIVEDIQQYPSIVITVISEEGCSITDTLDFTTLSLPMPDLDPVDNIVVCLGDDYTVELNSVDSVTWMTMDEMVLATGNTFELTNILSDTLYQIVFTTEAGCEIRDTFDIII